MKHNITRRDFLNGSLLALGSFALPPISLSETLSPLKGNKIYPPGLTGMRGNRSKAIETAHKFGFERGNDWSKPPFAKEQDYDLIVVGGGISGLAAARFFQLQHGLDKRILILEEHDDFGGHARRNEFEVNSQTRVNYGGSQSMDSPNEYSKETLSLLDDLGVNLKLFDQAYDQSFFRKNDLRPVTYFNKSVFGQDKVVDYTFANMSSSMPGMPNAKLDLINAVKQMPLSKQTKQQLLRVYKESKSALDNVAYFGRFEYIEKTPYFDFLKQKHNVIDPQVLNLLRGFTVDDWGVGTDVLSVLEAVASGAPGANIQEIPFYGKYIKEYMSDDGEPYIHHFPDGNATIARALVAKMIPAVSNVCDIEKIVKAKFNYQQLDREGAKVKLRLNSTVLNVNPIKNGHQQTGVEVTYIQQGIAHRVRGKSCVLACYNMMIPHLVPQLPKRQKKALKKNIKIPVIYTSVMLNNWQSLYDGHIGAAHSPGNMHQTMLMDFPVSIGDYHSSAKPEQPQALTMIHTPLSEEFGIPPIEQFKQGQDRIMTTSFETIEQEIKEHLSGMLSPSGFDPERDINAITVNRWTHGFTYGGADLFDPDMEENAELGRQSFGRITIANSDSGASAFMDSAIDQAWRAVREIEFR
ncbi:MAG: NAD(P)-binding protein [Gammaproteobacteria bacterium]|nr:NAD(P)-binding protein [Gammaproteobacteria bacterium]